MHLTSVKILKNYRNLKKNTNIVLPQLTLLVGDQGCGKSSLLKLLQENNQTIIEISISKYVYENSIDSFYFDSEKMNPRIADIYDYSNPNGTSKGIGVGGAISSKFKSHGEVLKTFTVDLICKAKNSVVLLDEPEAALSLKNQYRLASEINKALTNNVQFIIATHCLPLIESVENVYSLEHNMWLLSKDFINLNKNG